MTADAVGAVINAAASAATDNAALPSRIVLFAGNIHSSKKNRGQ
jgi:hypothetical protein